MVRVIDAPCGAGKTTWAINTINAHPEQSFIYCTPFLDEIERIRENCGRERFGEPENFNSTKIEDFNNILASGKSVAVTHVTFLNATDETLQLIYEGGYVLILDEVLDVICEFNSAKTVEESPAQRMEMVNVHFLIDYGLIRIKDDFMVEWIGPEYHDTEFKFYEVMKFAKMNRLYLARGKLLVSIFPPEIFTQFKDIYVLTYLFKQSMFDSYFRLFNIYSDMQSIRNNEIIPYTDDVDRDFKNKCKELIHVYEGKLNRPERTLSKAWYKSAKPEQLRQIKNDLRTYFKFVLDVSAKDGHILWTCPLDFKDKVKGHYYTRRRNMTKDELALPNREFKKLDKELSCFASCNAKSTNVYGNRYALAYCCNMFMNPLLKGLLKDLGVPASDDAFALSCLIQWIFRSRIRNDQPIELYLPSERMRKILYNWLNS